MSGIEFIVGTVLAAVPLALEAYDRSGRVFEVFSIFKKYPREVLILEAKLNAQRTIFRNNAINLLTAITKDRVKVQEVTNRPSSQVAKLGLVLASIYQNQINALDESFVACRQTAEQINNTLQLICSQFDVFRAEIDKKQNKASTSEWLKHIRTRFKLGLSKPEIGKAIEELRDFNRDFGLITEQITKALQGIINDYKDDIVVTRKSAKTLNILQGYHRVRYASKALYSTLQMQWVCSSHHCHSFDIRIIDRDPGKGKDKASVTQYVTCELAITHDGSSYASKMPLRLEIEQACESDDEDASPKQAVKENANMQQLTAVLETNADQFKLVNPAITKKSYQLLKGFKKDKKKQRPGPNTPEMINLTHSLAELQVQSPTSMNAVANAKLDLSLVDDFCKKFQEAMIHCMDRSLLGSWKNGPHAQWFSIPLTLQTALGTSQSLSEIIRWIAEEPILRSLPRPLLIELAGNLAEGIMQFYSTPWLGPINLGQKVRYFNSANSSTAAIKLKGPYFMAQLESAQVKGNIRHTSTNVQSEAADFTEARNKLLFNFGILLLEIGYGRPWHELKQSVAKMSEATGGKLSDYRIAEKLAQLLVNQMGLTYPKIIKKCLGCDFGLGETDLDNEELERRFLEDVVSGLKQLGNSMKEMDLAVLG